MKSIFSRSILLAVIAMACMSAHATVVPNEYNTTDGAASFNITNAAKVQFTSTQVIATYADNNTGYVTLTDSGSVVANKIKASSFFTTNFVYSASNSTYYNFAMAKVVICYAGTQTSIRWITGAGDNVNDNCALFAAIKAVSN